MSAYIGSILFSQLIKTLVIFCLKICLLKQLVNFMEIFCVVVKHFCNAVNVAEQWKNINEFRRKHLLWTSVLISLVTLGLF